MLKLLRKRVAIATVEVAEVVDLAAVATAVAEEDEMIVLEILGQDQTVEDVEVTAILLEDLHVVHPILNQVVGAISQERERVVENKPMC